MTPVSRPAAHPIDVVEADIAGLRAALAGGRTTSLDLVRAHLARIEALDPVLNAVPVRSTTALQEAAESDARRASGHLLGPLDGIPYTAKNSYLVRGLTCAAGSPAFEHLRAQVDAFTVERLRAGGAICLGLTTMPPMANGGMQRGLHGRAESPYNPEYLTSAFGSGSSNGSGTATAASLGVFGLGEETWSSGRAPASFNALCAYTPSRGVISVRGNWPLVPTMDVVVPHTRSMADLFEVLNVVVVDDHTTRGDFWRVQPWVEIPPASAVRPDDYLALLSRGPDQAAQVLRGKRFGVPAMYLNADPAAGTAEHPGIGGPTGRAIRTRPGVVELWQDLRRDLEAAGAEVVLTDFPVVSNYEGDRPGAPTIFTRGLVAPEFLRRELLDLSAWAWDDFLRANGDPDLPDLTVVDESLIFPPPPGALPDRYDGFGDDISAYPQFVRDHPDLELPGLADGLRGLERTRRVDLEQWMDELGLDAVVFPAMADIPRADMDVNPTSADHGWSNGVWVANGNLVVRHLGIPTVTVPMGTLPDIGMPVGLTIAGRAWDDTNLLRLASAIEATRPRRTAPPLPPVD